MGSESRRNSVDRTGRMQNGTLAPIVNIAERRSKRVPLHQGPRKTGIFIAVPSLDGNVNFSIALLFARAMASNTLDECPFRFTVHVEAGKRGADYARNAIVRTFLNESDADWLLMIDADQIVPENFWELCTVLDADVVGGISPVWVGHMDPETALRVNNYAVDSEGRCFNLPAPAPDATQPYRVPVVGTGAIAIRRRVFAPSPHGLGTIAPFYFTFLDDRRVRGGEDINFSVEAQRAGFSLAVHPKVWFDHMKAIPLRQIETYYQARKAMELAGKAPTQEQVLSLG